MIKKIKRFELSIMDNNNKKETLTTARTLQKLISNLEEVKKYINLKYNKEIK